MASIIHHQDNRLLAHGNALTKSKAADKAAADKAAAEKLAADKAAAETKNTK